MGLSNRLKYPTFQLYPFKLTKSYEFQHSFETEYSVAEIKQHPTEKNKLQLTIDGVSEPNWFRQKYQEFQKKIGINVQPKQDKSKGFGL